MKLYIIIRNNRPYIKRKKYAQFPSKKNVVRGTETAKKPQRALRWCGFISPANRKDNS